MNMHEIYSIDSISSNKKEWQKPILHVLNVNKTLNGGDPDAAEDIFNQTDTFSGS